MMRFGVNYIPSKQWLHSWIDFDEGAMREDLLAIRSLGFDHIRAHLLWSYFQINPTQMSRHCMKNLGVFVRLCEEIGLDFCLSLFTGCMSGACYIPAWMRKVNDFRMFSGEAERKGQYYYVEEIAKVVSGSPRFLGFDIGNELSCLAGLDRFADKKTLDAWHLDILALCEKVAPGKLHNSGMDHQPWFYDWSFSREVLANSSRINAVHCWTKFTEAMNRGGLTETASTHLTQYMTELIRAFCRDPHRPVWLQEQGCSPLWLGKGDSIAEFARKTLDASADLEDVWGFTWWCSHDIARSFTGYNELEYELGILDTENRPKPYAETISAWIADYRRAPKVPAPRTTAMVWYPDRNGADHWGNADRFMRLIDEGERPTIVLEKDASDSAFLAARGIRKIVE